MSALTVLYRGPLSSCNYGCAYCPFAKHHESDAEHAVDAAALERFLGWAERWPSDRHHGPQSLSCRSSHSQTFSPSRSRFGSRSPNAFASSTRWRTHPGSNIRSTPRWCDR